MVPCLIILSILVYVVVRSWGEIAFNLPGSNHTGAKKYGLALGDTLIWMNKAQIVNELNTIKQLGVGWIRIDLDWNDIQPDRADQYGWYNFDQIVSAANARGIKVLPIIAYTPPWARPSNCTESEQCAPASDNQFAKFAQTAAERYSAKGIHTWEIWNEPNLGGSWKPTPDPKSYAELLKTTYSAIKHADKHATVVSGGLGPLDGVPVSVNQLDFLAAMYADGARPYFDALGYHPYSFPAPPSYVVNWSSWSMMSALPRSLRSIMAANHDSRKQIWITEFGAPTNGRRAVATSNNYNFSASPDHVSEAFQSETLKQAIGQFKKTSWLGAFFWYDYQDLGTSRDTNENFFGLIKHDGVKKPAFYTYQHEIQTSR